MSNSSDHSRQLSEGEFMRLFVKHEPALRAFARSLLPDWDCADEAIQEASVTMWEKLGQLRDADGFLPWAKVILRFKCLSAIASLRRRRHVLRDDVLQLIADEAEAMEAEDLAAVRRALTTCLTRLTGQGKTATIARQSLVVSEAGVREETVERSHYVVRIGTNGRATTVRRDTTRKKPVDPEVLAVKRTKGGKRDHHCIFAFDLSPVNLDQVASVQLRLNLVPSTRGFAARLPTINRFGIYGLTNSGKKDWELDSPWEEAPGPADGVLLGTFEILRSQQRGSFGVGNGDLLEFLRANQDGPVTLIVIRETTQIQGFGPGLTHTFASGSHPEAVGPMLEFSLPR